jgi:hypothetical protein
MTPYKSNSGKKSGVAAYKIGEDYILVRFGSGQLYKYTYGSAGRPAVDEMKTLAIAQQRLSTFISQHNPRYV